MALTLHLTLPDDLSGVVTSRLPAQELSRWVLEAVAIEAYREHFISRGRLGEILGLEFHERERFLSDRGIPYQFDTADLDADSRTLEELLGPIQR